MIDKSLLGWVCLKFTEKTTIIKLTALPLATLLGSMEITQIKMKKRVKVKVNVHKIKIIGSLLKHNTYACKCPQRQLST